MYDRFGVCKGLSRRGGLGLCRGYQPRGPHQVHVPPPQPMDLLIVALAALFGLPLDHPDVVASALAVQELAPHLPDLLKHGYGRISGYVKLGRIVSVAVEKTHLTRDPRGA